MPGQIDTGATRGGGVAIAPAQAHFTHYLENRSLPVSNAEVRAVACDGALMTLVSHLPTDGIWFDAIDDLIISIVVKSDYSEVWRDVGDGVANFREGPGCVLVTPPQTPSYWRFNGNPLVLHVSVPPENFRELTGVSGAVAELANVAQSPVYDRLVSQLTSRMWTELAIPRAGEHRFVSHALGTLLALLLRSGPQPPPACGTPRQVHPLAAWRLRKTLHHIMSRLAEPVTLDELAALVELSPGHLLRSFTAAMNQTPYQWQMSVRIEEAKRLLRESRASMTDIALGLGFSSSAHFSTRFKQLTGMPPSSWRAAFGPDEALTGALRKMSANLEG